MAMRGYTRIIVEPSGVYDTDEFFDVLYEEPLINYYEVGNVFVLYDINTKNLSEESEYIFVSEAAVASKLIITKRDNKSLILDTNYINGLMKKYMCDRVFMDRDIVYNDSLNMDDIINAGYASYDHIKLRVIEDNNYDSLYIMNKKLNKVFIIDLMNKLFNSKAYGNILRIKGFIYENDKWYKVNITRNDTGLIRYNGPGSAEMATSRIDGKSKLTASVLDSD
jgi:G3E family GTPase